MVDRLQKDLIFTSKSDKATLIASRVVRLYMGDVETHQYFELLRGDASDIDQRIRQSTKHGAKIWT